MRRYRGALRHAYRTYTSTLEDLRLSQPAAFWRLLTPELPLVQANTQALFAHYSSLLSHVPSTYAPEYLLPPPREDFELTAQEC